MKKVIFYLPVLILLISCSQEEQDYSCNPMINFAVKENLSTAKELNRSEWLQLQEDFKIPVYRTFSETKKLFFWKEKFAEVKKLRWSPKELKHIISAEHFLYKYPQILSCETASDDILNKRDLFIHEWTEYAMNKLKWNKATIISIVACGNKVVNTKGYIEIVKKGKLFHYSDRRFNTMSLEDGDTLDVDTTDYNIPDIPNNTDTTGIAEPYTCHCNKDNLIDFCTPGTICGNSIIKCTGSLDGCGWFLGEPCNGICL